VSNTSSNTLLATYQKKYNFLLLINIGYKLIQQYNNIRTIQKKAGIRGEDERASNNVA
jgi:hypothetical protein